MRRSIGQSITRISATPPPQIIGTIIDIDSIGVDASGTTTAVSPSMVVNVHGISGFKRLELAGLDATKLRVGDNVFIEKRNDRFMITGLMPISNRTQAGDMSFGTGSGMQYLTTPVFTHAVIAGTQLELGWTPIDQATMYDILASVTADPTSDDALVIATTPNTTWVSARRGRYFDDGMYYAVVARGAGSIAGNISDFIQPTFTGHYASGLTSMNQTTNIPGSLTVTKAGSILRSAFTSVNSPATVNIDVNDPQGAHPTTPLFANNDILRCVDDNGNKLWLKVNSSTDKTTYWQYNVTKQYPTSTNYTIPTGSQIADWGQSGQGVFLVSADGTFGAGTLWQIITHTGSPWSSYTAQVSANSAGQITAGLGAVVVDVNGISLFDATNTNPNSVKWHNVAGTDIIAKAVGYVSAPFNVLALTATEDGTNPSAEVDITASGAGSDILFSLVAENGSTSSWASLSGGGFVGIRIGDASAATGMVDVLGLFVVDTNGDIEMLNGVPTSFPAANTAGVLTNDGSGNYSIQAAGKGAKSQLFGNLLASTVTALATVYFGAGTTATGVTEANERTPIGYAGAASNFYMRTSSAQPVTGTLVLTVLKNGSATALTITIAAGAAAGLFSDTTHSFTFAAGDELSVSAVNNATLTPSAGLQGWSVELIQA